VSIVQSTWSSHSALVVHGGPELVEVTAVLEIAVDDALIVTALTFTDVVEAEVAVEDDDAVLTDDELDTVGAPPAPPSPSSPRPVRAPQAAAHARQKTTIPAGRTRREEHRVGPVGRPAFQRRRTDVCKGTCEAPSAGYPPSLHTRSLLLALVALVFAPACSCGSNASLNDTETEQRKLPIDDSEPLLEPPEAGKLVYLVTKERKLYSFDPRKPGMSAYDFIGTLQCERSGFNPQSMAVDRKGTAWVFYDSGKLYRVSTADASCTPTTYSHPSWQTMLGMGFTSVAPGSDSEQLYIMSPAFGLATVEMPALGVNQLGSHRLGGSELTGGGDARLFAFQAQAGELHEIDRASLSSKLLYKLKNPGYVRAWAFARYAGRFYFWTASYSDSSKCIEVDVERNLQRVRDDDLGFVVVGAGQSTLVPPRDTSESIQGDWPEDGM
jgi:hypothetical protein